MCICIDIFMSIRAPLAASSLPVLLVYHSLTASQLIIEWEILEKEREKPESSTNNDYNALHMEKIVMKHLC